jgi:hypothetical protein
MTFPLEISRNEPWNAWHAEALLKGLPLYPDPQGLVANNYPPLSFYLISELSRGSVDAIYAGRLLSVIAIVVVCVAVAKCIRILGGSRLSALIGALWLLITVARFYDVYFGMNDPQLPALAIMATALAWALVRIKDNRAVEPAIALMVLAGFYKHNLIATPIATLLWIAFKDWRRGVRAAIFGALLAATGLMLCVELYGFSFIAQLLFPREYSLWAAIVGLRGIHRISFALVLWMIWIWYDRDSEAAKFTRLYVAAALAAFFLEKFGDGVGLAADFELVVAIAICVGCTITHLSKIPLVPRRGLDRSCAVIVTLLSLQFVFSGHDEPYLVLTSSKFRQAFENNSLVVDAEIDRIRHTPGKVSCSVMTVCYRAGKSFVFDEFFIQQKILTQPVTGKEVKAKIGTAGIRFVTVDPRATVDCTVDPKECRG